MNTRYIKPAGGTYGPRHLVTVCVTGKPANAAAGQGRADEVWDTAHICWSHYRDGKWSPVGHCTPATGAELLDIVDGLARPRTGTAVVCPVASYTLTLSGALVRWWEEGWKWSKRSGVAGFPATTAPLGGPSASPPAPAPGSRSAAVSSASHEPIVSTCILRGNPDIVRYTRDQQQYTWSSGHNWYPSTEESIAETMQFQWSNPGEKWRGKHPPKRSARDRSMLWMAAMQRLANWWRQIDGGPWAWTIGGLAMSYFRKRLQPKTVLSHQVDAAREIEERALFGGRAQTYCLAPIGSAAVRSDDGHAPPPRSDYERLDGPLEHWDIASMYPTILASQPFPCKYWMTDHNPPVARLESDLKRLGVIADVTLETDTPDYPARDEERVIWPVGRFRTSLCGPELARAVRAGHVVHCHREITYSMGRPFAASATSLLALRQHARTVGDPVWEQLVKALSNAFGGKLAQIKYDWCAAPKINPMVAWGEWDEPSPATRKMTTYRSAAGLVWEKQAHKHKGRPLASCFGYLTSYGRELMHELRQLLPADQLVSMDTDGLWVRRPTPGQWTRVRKAAMARGYTLRRTAVSEAGQWYGPRHYWTTAGWILAGYHEPRRVARDLTFRDSQTTIPPASLSEGPPKRIRVTTRTTKLTTLPVDGQVDAGGFVTPRRLTAHDPRAIQSPSSTELDSPPTT